MTTTTNTQSRFVKSFLAGSISGTCSTLLFQPLDLLKTRIQLLDKTETLHQSNRSLVRITISIVRQDTIFGLWRGLVPSLVRTVPGIGVYFCSLHYLTRRFQSREPPPPLESLTMAACARCIAGLSTLPFTVLKTRYESGFFSYRSVLQGLASIYATEGYRGLYSGLSATLLRDVPFSGLYFMFYTQSKNMILTNSAGETNKGPMVYFACGIFAGCLASLVTHPADVIKTRLQLNPVHLGDMRRAFHYVLQLAAEFGFTKLPGKKSVGFGNVLICQRVTLKTISARER